MRNLIDILEALKENNPVAPDEFKFALLALDALAAFDRNALQKLSMNARKGRELNLDSAREESFKRWKKAFMKPPDEYVGWNNDPANPLYQERRRMFRSLSDRIMEVEKKEI